MKATSYTMHRLATDESARPAVIETARSTPNGEIEDVERAIAAYEEKFRMSSVEAYEAIAAGNLTPTREIEGWMMTLRVRNHHADAKTRAR